MNQICFVEHDVSHPGNFVYDSPETHDWWLLILTHSPAEFLINDKMMEYPAECMVLYPPNTKICYRSCSDSYKNDWLRFYTTESYILNTDIPLGIPVHIANSKYCNQLFQMLASENLYNNYYRESSIESLFRLLFYKLSEAYHNNSAQIQNKDLTNLRFDIKNNPGFPWTVPFMADRLHLSTGHVQALYRKNFHTTCMEDVIYNRILLAKNHLSQSTYSIADIAGICGYNNIEHFCRQFKQITGQTPNNYRKASASLPYKKIKKPI